MTVHLQKVKKGHLTWLITTILHVVDLETILGRVFHSREVARSDCSFARGDELVARQDHRHQPYSTSHLLEAIRCCCQVIR